MYINQCLKKVELPYLWYIVVLLPQKRFFGRFWRILISPFTVPYIRNSKRRTQNRNGSTPLLPGTQSLYVTVMTIFQNDCGKSLNNCSFRCGADELKNVKSYKYPGLIVSPFGNLNLARQELKKVALKALYKLERKYKINDEVIWCIACVAGVFRERGRGNLGSFLPCARSRALSSLPLPFRTPATQAIWCTDISHTLLCEWIMGDWLQWTIQKESSRISSNIFL